MSDRRTGTDSPSAPTSAAAELCREVVLDQVQMNRLDEELDEGLARLAARSARSPS